MKILNSQLQFKFEIPVSPLHFEYLFSLYFLRTKYNQRDGGKSTKFSKTYLIWKMEIIYIFNCLIQVFQQTRFNIRQFSIVWYKFSQQPRFNIWILSWEIGIDKISWLIFSKCIYKIHLGRIYIYIYI